MLNNGGSTYQSTSLPKAVKEGTVCPRLESPPQITLDSNNSCSSTATETQGDVTIHSRAYQLEMLEESLKKNVIVAMDTGSGKTHVAVLRIKKELEIASAEKLIWVLTPTVALCSQQLDVLKSQISSVQIKSFTSNDNVARWTKKEDWDAVLMNVKIVVSTYAVLHEALFHSLIMMESLALIVFDEAHNCTGRSPGSKIMRDVYWPRKEKQQPVPHILGLTASPVMGSNLAALETLESLLDAACKTPLRQKGELLLHVKRPVLTQVQYDGAECAGELPSGTCAMASLRAVYCSLNINDDPEIIRLRTTNTEVSMNKMERALKKRKTFIQDQLKSFCRRSNEIHGALGSWAADFYVLQVTSSFIQSVASKDARFLEWADSEKRYLANALRRVDVAPETLPVLSEEKSISDKVRALIKFLHSCDAKTIIGIIFVKERATAYVLHRLLSDCPDTCGQFRLETIVGMSKRPPGKRDICELSHPENQSKTLDKFRSGEINLIIATSVLEEGIDVPQCNLVICFDAPTNLKSFIQCRGRARLRESKLVMFLDKNSRGRISEWEELEREMKRRYEVEERNVQKLAELEMDETEQCQRRKFKVPSTGAQLDMEAAKGHLECFCSRVFSQYSAEMRPQYIVLEEGNGAVGHDRLPLLRAKVILPATLDPSLQVRKSKDLWYSEKNATSDAAFEAYIALYHAGLVNDNLLPLRFTDSSECVKEQDSIIDVREQFDPWPGVSKAWKSKETLEQRLLTLKDENGLIKCKVEMLVPVNLSDMKTILIHRDASTRWKIEVGPPTNVQQSGLRGDHTTTLLSHSYGHRWEVEDKKHTVLFKLPDLDVNETQLDSLPVSLQDCMDDSAGLLRDQQNHGHPYLFHRWLSTKPKIQSIQNPHKEYESFSEDQPFVALKRWPRRSDFLHEVSSDPGAEKRSTKEYFSVLPQPLLEMDVLPMNYSQFGLLIPSILHKVEVQLVVQELAATVLAGVEISDNDLIRTAISTPKAREENNYQKLEFLGDSVLKLVVSIFLASKYSHWPEGYLSTKKASIISNSRLCKAGIERGLDKFILTKVFTGRKWRPFYVDTVLNHLEGGTREMSSKTIADVLESLIGAGWKMGHFQTSLSVIKTFLPEVDLPSLEVGRAQLFDLGPTDTPLPVDLRELEKLAGYSFKKKSLLVQAMSHSSDITGTSSYERLEFLGDAVLETIITTELFAYQDELSHSLMHLYRTALVNGDYLGFIALEWNIAQEKSDLKEDVMSGLLTEVKSQFSLPLWRFMRHGSFDIGTRQREVEDRHASLRHDILRAIESSTHYPWVLLARLHANKFYSDVVESLLGAVWVDSGSMDACKQVLDRMGILRYLHRLVQGQVHAVHPREELSVLADRKEVKYDVQVRKMDDGTDEWTCAVFVGDSQVIEVGRGVSYEEVRTRAADEAVSLLRSANGRSGSPISYGERISRIR